jgi:hypothetical protein
MSDGPVARTTAIAPAPLSGVEPRLGADLPVPPTPKGLGWPWKRASQIMFGASRKWSDF